jgi:hypothetical protein
VATKKRPLVGLGGLTRNSGGSLSGTTSAIDVTPAVRRAFAEAVAAPIFRERVRFACRR